MISLHTPVMSPRTSRWSPNPPSSYSNLSTTPNIPSNGMIMTPTWHNVTVRSTPHFVAQVNTFVYELKTYLMSGPLFAQFYSLLPKHQCYYRTKPTWELFLITYELSLNP